jgi:hypothetical protein
MHFPLNHWGGGRQLQTTNGGHVMLQKIHNSLKQMGLVLSSSSFIPSQRLSTSESERVRTARKKLRKKRETGGVESVSMNWTQIAGWAGVVGLVAVFGGIVWRSFP